MEWAIISGCFFLVFISGGSTMNYYSDKPFDFLMFTQVWPISNCIEWEERSDENTCTIKSRTDWTVHGIWPTKNGEEGPFHCRDEPFDPEKIDSIRDQLETHWTNVHANSKKESFWKHEWEKHGTCAMQLSSFSSELKYFSEGLDLNQKYPVAQYLNAMGIISGGSYTTKQVLEAVKIGLGGKVNPGLQCDKWKDYDEPALMEVRICLDKQLELIDCNHVAEGIYGRCPKNGSIKYPSHEKSYFATGTVDSPEPVETSSHISLIMGGIIGVGVLFAALGLIAKFITNIARNRGYNAV